MPSKEWLEKYEAVKEKLRCKKDLDAYFTEKEIGGTPVDCRFVKHLLQRA